MRDQVEQDEITQDQNGSIYPQPKPSIFDHFDEVEYKPITQEFSDELDAILGHNNAS